MLFDLTGERKQGSNDRGISVCALWNVHTPIRGGRTYTPISKGFDKSPPARAGECVCAEIHRYVIPIIVLRERCSVKRHEPTKFTSENRRPAKGLLLIERIAVGPLLLQLGTGPAKDVVGRDTPTTFVCL